MEKKMEEFKLIKRSKIEEIIGSIERLKEDCSVLINVLKKEDAILTLGNTTYAIEQEKIEIKAFRKEGPTLASIIYDRIPLSKFTAKQVYETIGDQIKFTGDRPIDSIRTALRNDTKRFKKISKGEYQKIE